VPFRSRDLVALGQVKETLRFFIMIFSRAGAPATSSNFKLLQGHDLDNFDNFLTASRWMPGRTQVPHECIAIRSTHPTVKGTLSCPQFARSDFACLGGLQDTIGMEKWVWSHVSTVPPPTYVIQPPVFVF
jgi:hypothetical protein